MTTDGDIPPLSSYDSWQSWPDPVINIIITFSDKRTGRQERPGPGRRRNQLSWRLTGTDEAPPLSPPEPDRPTHTLSPPDLNNPTSSHIILIKHSIHFSLEEVIDIGLRVMLCYVIVIMTSKCLFLQSRPLESLYFCRNLLS